GLADLSQLARRGAQRRKRCGPVRADGHAAWLSDPRGRQRGVLSHVGPLCARGRPGGGVERSHARDHLAPAGSDPGGAGPPASLALTPSMDDSQEFEAQNLADIEAMGKDADLHRLTQAWFEHVTAHRYSYHFRWMGLPIIQFPQDIVA